MNLMNMKIEQFVQKKINVLKVFTVRLILLNFQIQLE